MELEAIHATFGDDAIVATVAREIDWSKTPLGPVRRWPALLRSLVRLVIASPQPTSLYWGPDALVFPNDAAIEPFRDRVRVVFGRSFFTAFPEEAERERAIYARVLRGESVLDYVPIRELDGTVAGAFVASRKRPEGDRDGYLLALVDRLRSLSDADEIRDASTELLAKELGASRCYYTEYDVDHDVAWVAAEHLRGDMPSMIGHFKADAFGEIVAGLTAGESIVEDDCLENRLGQDAARFSNLRNRSQVSVPIVRGGKLVATLTVNDTEPRAWSAAEVALVAATAQRARAAVDLGRAEAAKDEFLATLSHELRTPLTTISLWAGALRGGKVPPEQLSRAIGAIVVSAENQSRLIEDLVDLSRLRSGKLAFLPSPVDVRRLVASAVETIAPMAEAKSVSLSTEVPEDLGSAVLDWTRVKQVLWNLLANAVKFTPEGGSVTLRVRKAGSHLVAEVVDTGEGISPEFLSHVFERFQQADKSDARRRGGLGIGLALSKQLVELHGGTIEAESAGLGLGSTFRVRVPWVEPIASFTRTEPATLGDAPLASLRVLLVEDEEDTREAMRWTLERAGARVTAVGSAEEALDHADAAEVVVSDLSLRGTSGFELVARIIACYEERGRKAPPSCAVSAHARDVDRRRAIAAGFDMYLAKPVTPDRLIEAVADLSAMK